MMSLPRLLGSRPTPATHHNPQIRLEGPLKELGLYTVKVHLHRDIDAELKVWVVPSVSGEGEEK